MIVVTRRLMYAWPRHYYLGPVKKFVATLNATYIVIVERISAACIVLMQSANRHPSDVKISCAWRFTGNVAIFSPNYTISFKEIESKPSLRNTTYVIYLGYFKKKSKRQL